MHGDNVTGLVVIRLDLATEFRYEIIDGSGQHPLGAAPDIDQQAFAAHDLAAVRHKVHQEVELARRQIQWLRTFRRGAGLGVHDDVADAGCIRTRLERLLAAQVRAHARHQLADAERLSDVVIGAELEARDAIELGIARG